MLPGIFINITNKFPAFPAYSIVIVDCQGFLPQTCYGYNNSQKVHANIELYGVYVFRQKRITNTIRKRKGNHGLKEFLYKMKVHHPR